MKRLTLQRSGQVGDNIMPIEITSINVNGLSELDLALEQLIVPKFRKAALRKAGKAAMKPVLRDAISNAPVLQDGSNNPNAISGQLRNDIKMSTTVNVEPTTRSGRISNSKLNELKVVVKTGKDTEDYALVTEFGRDEFQVVRNEAFGKATSDYVTTVASLRPQPYMQPALESNVDLIIRTFGDELGDEIIKQARKQARYLGE